MIYVIVAAVLAVLAAVGAIWYNSRKRVAAEISTVTEKTAREAAEKQVDSLEQQRAKENTEAHLKDQNEGTEVVDSGSGKRAGDFLRASFPDRNRPR